MSLISSLAIIIIMIVISMIIYKDIMSPAFLMLIPWAFSFFMLIGSELYYVDRSPAYTYIIIGLMLFQIFYGVTYSGIEKNSIKEKQVYYLNKYADLRLNSLVMWGLIVFETITMAYYLRLLINGHEPIGIFEYIHKMVFAIFYLLILHVCTCSDEEKKRSIIYVGIHCIPLILALLLPSNGRASYFVFILGAIFIYLTFRDYNTFRILKYFTVLLSVLVFLFIYVAIRKNHISSTSIGVDLIIETRNWLTHYLSGSLITFSRWLPSWEIDFSFGRNTFRIIYAVLERIGFDVEVVSTFFPFLQIGASYSNISNVYTVFYTYIVDFGYLGGWIVEAILGVLYAKMYINKDTHRIGSIYLYAIFMYALLMQCFADQYVAILSYYMQMYLWYFLFYKCQILFWNSGTKIRIVRY